MAGGSAALCAFSHTMASESLDVPTSAPDSPSIISMLGTVTPSVEAVPVVGAELAQVLGLATQVYQFAEDVKVHRGTYKRLAREVVTYAVAVSRAAQASLLPSSAAPGSEEGSESRQESWMKSITELASIFREVAQIIEKRKAKDEKLRGRFLGRARRPLYNIRHKDNDREQVERLRKGIEESVGPFHIGGEIWESGALERMASEIKDTAACQAQEAQPPTPATQIEERESVATHPSQESEAVDVLQAQNSEAPAVVQSEEPGERDMDGGSFMNTDIKNQVDNHEQILPPELRYAYKYWLDHIINSDLNSSLVNHLDEFCERHLLHWIEALSLIEKISVAHISIPDARNRRQEEQALGAASTAPLIEDIQTVLKTPGPALRSNALQAYCSVLVFMPENRLHEDAGQETGSAVVARSKRLQNWPWMRQNLEGHKESVSSVAYSSDGKWIVTGSRDKTVRVWDAITGAARTEFNGHTNYVSSVAFSPDGMRIASGSNDKTVRVWDAINGVALAELQGHTGYVTCVAFSPDGTCIASGSNDRSVRVWDAITGALVAELSSHTTSVRSVAFSPHGTRIAAGSFDRTVRVWDIATKGDLATIRCPTGLVNSVAFSPDGSRVAFGSQKHVVHVCDATTGDSSVDLTGHADSVNSVTFSPDGARIASGSTDGTVRIWDAVTGDVLAKIHGHTRPVNSVAYLPDGTRIASGSDDMTVRVWDAITGAALAKFDGRANQASSITPSEDGTQIVLQDNHGRRHMWVAGKRFQLDQLDPQSALHTLFTSPSPSKLSFDNTSGRMQAVQTSDPGLTYLSWVPPEQRGEFRSSNDLGALWTDYGGITIVCCSGL